MINGKIKVKIKLIIIDLIAIYYTSRIFSILIVTLKILLKYTQLFKSRVFTISIHEKN